MIAWDDEHRAYNCAGFVGGESCAGWVQEAGDLCNRTDHDVWTQAEIDEINRRGEALYRTLVGGARASEGEE